MEELNTLAQLRYTKNTQSRATKNAAPKTLVKACTCDEISVLVGLKYAKKPQVNIFPIEVDFPLPTGFEGSQDRLNSSYNLEIPAHFGQRNKPANLVGSILRIDYLLSNAAKYIDQDVTVAGWANSVRLQANDTLVFIELVDGTSPVPLQVVVSNQAGNFDELKKAKKAYSFRVFGKIIKSIGKGQEI